MGHQTTEFLEKEIELLTEARDGILVAFNLIKRDTKKEDEHLRDLYNKFDGKIKSHNRTLGLIREEEAKVSVAG